MRKGNRDKKPYQKTLRVGKISELIKQRRSANTKHIEQASLTTRVKTARRAGQKMGFSGPHAMKRGGVTESQSTKK